MATMLYEAYPSIKCMDLVASALKFQPHLCESKHTKVEANYKKWLREGVSADIGDLLLLLLHLDTKQW